MYIIHMYIIHILMHKKRPRGEEERPLGDIVGPWRWGRAQRHARKAQQILSVTRGMVVVRGRGRSVRRVEAPRHSQLDLEHDVSEASPLPTNSKRFSIRLHQGLPLPEIIYIYSGGGFNLHGSSPLPTKRI